MSPHNVLPHSCVLIALKCLHGRKLWPGFLTLSITLKPADEVINCLESASCINSITIDPQHFVVMSEWYDKLKESYSYKTVIFCEQFHDDKTNMDHCVGVSLDLPSSRYIVCLHRGSHWYLLYYKKFFLKPETHDYKNPIKAYLSNLNTFFIF